MVVMIRTLTRMAARAGHHLTGSRVEDIFTYGMGKYTMFPMTFATDSIDRRLDHGRMIRAMGGMAVIAGICHLVAVFSLIVSPECCFMTFVADVALLTLEQPIIISCVWSMTGHAAIVFITDQVVMG